MATFASWLFDIPGFNSPFCILYTFFPAWLIFTLKMVAADSFKMFVLIFQSVWCHSPQNCNLNALCQISDSRKHKLCAQVEKSLQRIHRGQKNAMYTTQKSIENKVGHVSGWKDLLMSVGFRFEPAANGIPSSVFFPQSDPDERLTQCSASLQALLGRCHGARCGCSPSVLAFVVSMMCSCRLQETLVIAQWNSYM